MMTLCATRRTSSLLCTIAILFALMTTSIVSAADQTYDLVVAINGSTFIYNKLMNMNPAQLYPTPFAADIKVAVGGIADISNVFLSVNDSALYVYYTATVSPPYTDVDVLSQVAEAELPATNAALAVTKFVISFLPYYSIYTSFFPTNVRPFTPLLPPDETTTTPAPVITTILNSTHTLYLTGDESAWRDVLQVAQVSLASAVSDAVVESLQHNNDKVACKTDGLAVRGADPTLTLPGDGRGGLTARVTVSQFVTAKTQHAYNPLEVNSALLNLNTLRIRVIYYTRVAWNSSSPTMVCTTTPYSVVAAKKSSMIAFVIFIAVVFGVLTIVAAIVIVLLVFRLPVCVRVSDELSDTSSRRSGSRDSAGSSADTDSYVSDWSVQSSKRGSQRSSSASSQSQRKSMSRNSSVRSSQSMSTRDGNRNMSATSTRLSAVSLPSHGSVSAQSFATPSAYAYGQSYGVNRQAASQRMTPFPHNPLQSARY